MAKHTGTGLLIESETRIPDERETFKIKQLLHTYYISDRAIMYYVSENETFVKAGFVTNESGKFHFAGWSDEYDLSDPNSFVLNGDPEQYIGYSYSQVHREGTVFGWKYASAPPVLVNGKETQTTRYTFECNGKIWELDYWWCDDVQSDDITISYDLN